MDKRANDRSKQGDGKHIQPKKMRGFKYPTKNRTFSKKDIALYALSIGLAQNPLNKNHFKFVYEND